MGARMRRDQMYGGDVLTRRRLLELLAAGAAGAAVVRPRVSRAADPILERRIPSSGEMLPAVGIGTWRVFDVGTSDEARAPIKEVLRRFAELGGRAIDSSPMYGAAETVVGDLATEVGVLDRLFLATKVWTSGREAGIRQMDESFRRLRASRVDLMQIHNLLDWSTHLRTLREWKAKGRIRYVGVTHYTESAYDELERVLRAEALDFVQVNYSVDERESERRILPLARERGVAVIANRPFAEGALFGRVRGKPLPAWAVEIECDSWAQVFLKWILGNPAVTCVIPGTGKPEHLLDNMKAAAGRLPDAAMRARIAAALR
jgi:diketogulonate reductase-like aldo/keto reductase